MEEPDGTTQNWVQTTKTVSRGKFKGIIYNITWTIWLQLTIQGSLHLPGQEDRFSGVLTADWTCSCMYPYVNWVHFSWFFKKLMGPAELSEKIIFFLAGQKKASIFSFFSRLYCIIILDSRTQQHKSGSGFKIILICIFEVPSQVQLFWLKRTLDVTPPPKVNKLIEHQLIQFLFKWIRHEVWVYILLIGQRPTCSSKVQSVILG